MPEGPEVYVMTTNFARRFPPSHLITRVTALHQRYEPDGDDSIPPAFIDALPLKISKIYNRGKKTIVKLNKNWSLLVSYGMSGHWETNQSDAARLEFFIANSVGFEVLYYWTSSRNLPTSCVQFLNHEQLDRELNKLGLDIIHDHPDPDQVLDVYGKSRMSICAFLMDQSKFSGVGNYIKAVVLYRCKISPHRKLHELDDETKWEIWETAQQVAQEAIAAKGMGMRDYKDETGQRVGVAFDITPYNMKRDRFGNPVKSETIAGRTTWWVPNVQK